LEGALEKKCFDEVMVQEIEPRLGLEKPVILYDYPASMAALSRLKPTNPRLAERFEIYAGRLELANGFSELNNAAEQRARFERDRQERQKIQKPVYPMPERFIKALELLPDSAGIAMGLDRLVMLFADRSEIDQVVTFTPEEL
jgi:lysyl-tRNA synthetase class 2